MDLDKLLGFVDRVSQWCYSRSSFSIESAARFLRRVNGDCISSSYHMIYSSKGRTYAERLIENYNKIGSYTGARFLRLDVDLGK